MATAIAVNLTVVAVLIAAGAPGSRAAAYANHTVGGAAAGWAFNATTNTSAANYSAWAAAESFGLGDFLVFKTNTNQTVVQTYNLTTYQNCTADESSDDDTFIYNGGSTQFGAALTVAVPLIIVGPNYFFSDADDGVQCQHGMAFAINVTRGLGLPPSLNQPPPPPYAVPPPTDSVGTPPVTVDQPQQTSGGANLRGGALCYSFLLAGGIFVFLLV